MANPNTEKYWDLKYAEKAADGIFRSDGEKLNRFMPAFHTAHSVLDFGGGLGGNLKHLASLLNNKKFILVEHSEFALRYAKNEYLGTKDDRSNSFDYHLDLSQLAPGSVDLVMSIEVLEHITEYNAVISGLWNLVAPGGHMLISVPVKGWRDRNREHVNKFTVKSMFGILSEYSEIVQISARSTSRRSGRLSTAYFCIGKPKSN